VSTTPRVLALTVAAALFMEQMDSTIIATSLPDIAKDLGTDPVSLKLAFTTYLLGLSVMLPISGWLADRFGARFIFRLAIVLFTIGSVSCGFANSLEALVAARGLQGVGGALMVPVGRIIILRSVQKSELLDTIAWMTIPALVGPVVGPLIGGYITTTYDWRWNFWMNLPFGILAFGLATWLMPVLKAETVAPLDWKGFWLSALGLTFSVFGMTVAGREMFATWQVIAMVIIGLALLAAYVQHARVTPHPLLDLKLMRIPTFRYSVYGGNIYRIIVGATPFLVPLMLQLGFGYTAFEAGAITFASALGAFLMKFTVAPIVRRFGFRNLLIYNGIAACALVAAKSLFTVETSYTIMIAVLFLAGFTRSLQFSSLNTLAYADVDHEGMAKANALYTVAQQLSLAIGVSVAAFMLDGILWWQGRVELQASDFAITLFTLALISATAIIPYMKLASNAGESVSGKRDQAADT
jgi:EmrB/QacA subfamily drug resistance transporter